ncbi:MAG: L-rhamnose isomerase [Melioribacteraceae bacterium]
MKSKNIEQAYLLAKESYSELGVDTDLVLQKLKNISISLHCWQGDDVGGFETAGAELSGGGIQATGNYPGKARNADELRADLEKTYSLLPGNHRLNLHAIYLENDGKKIERTEVQPEHFSRWIDWAKENTAGLDFNPSFFSHPLADDGFTISSNDKSTREFWIQHGKATRKIAAVMGEEMGSPCVNNVWIPDGYKNIPIDKRGPRERLVESLDEIFSDDYDKDHLLDAVESKLFGIGSESYVVGSHEFYLGYAIKNKKLLCLDAGHFHPTESISDKISSVMLYLDEILLHVSRAVRWDSDHVVTMNDDLHAIAEQLVRGNYLERTHIGLDFFDASINRVAAWVTGTRNMIKALLITMLEPIDTLRKFENNNDFTSRLAMLEELKTMPFGAVWDYYCLSENIPTGMAWLEEVKTYEKNVLSKRS